jgi:hypothetical protein
MSLLTQNDVDDLPPSLRALPRFIANIWQSDTGKRIGISASWVHHLCLFPSHRIPVSQVPYKSQSWSHAFSAPDTVRTVNGFPSHLLYPGERRIPRFRCRLNHRELRDVPKVRTCRSPLRKPSAYVPLVKLSNVARRTRGQGHTPQRVPAAAGCLYLGFFVSDNCCPRVHAREKTRRRPRPLREGAAAAAGRAPNGALLPCAK